MFSPFLIGMRTEGEKSRFFSPSIAKKTAFRDEAQKRKSQRSLCILKKYIRLDK